MHVYVNTETCTCSMNMQASCWSENGLTSSKAGVIDSCKAPSVWKPNSGPNYVLLTTEISIQLLYALPLQDTKEITDGKNYNGNSPKLVLECDQYVQEEMHLQ